MPVGIALPNLETLFMYQPTHDFQLGTGSLPSLTELSFGQTDQIPMEKILSVIGHQLRKLSVKVSDTLHLDTVFRMCPNLQVLYVPECPVDYIGLKDELLNCNLRSLTELCFVEGYDDHDRTLVKPDHLLQILQAAPNLQIFQMHTPIFSEQDGKDFRLALEQHLILQKLQQFTFSYDLPETDADKLSANIGRSVINSIISLCPRLSTVNVKNNELKFNWLEYTPNVCFQILPNPCNSFHVCDDNKKSLPIFKYSMLFLVSFSSIQIIKFWTILYSL